MSRTSLGLLGLFAGALLVLCFVQSAMTRDDRDCPDFATKADAQAYFDERGGSPGNDVDRLDADHDGIACESLPSGTPDHTDATPLQSSAGTPIVGTPMPGGVLNVRGTPITRPAPSSPVTADRMGERTMSRAQVGGSRFQDEFSSPSSTVKVDLYRASNGDRGFRTWSRASAPPEGRALALQKAQEHGGFGTCDGRFRTSPHRARSSWD